MITESLTQTLWSSTDSSYSTPQQCHGPSFSGDQISPNSPSSLCRMSTACRDILIQIVGHRLIIYYTCNNPTSRDSGHKIVTRSKLCFYGFCDLFTLSASFVSREWFYLGDSLLDVMKQKITITTIIWMHLLTPANGKWLRWRVQGLDIKMIATRCTQLRNERLSWVHTVTCRNKCEMSELCIRQRSRWIVLVRPRLKWKKERSLYP